MPQDVFSEIFEAGYTIVNHDMVKKLDLTAAYWLCEIISWMRHLRKRKRLDEDGWFYYTQEHIEKKIGISAQRQNRIIKKLKSIRIMDVEKRGLPAKNYFRINYEKLVTFLYGDSSSSINLIGTDLLKQRDYYNNKDKYIYPMKSKNGLHGCPLKIERKANIRPAYYRFAQQIQEKQIQNHPTRFKQYSPDQLGKQISNGAEVIDCLVRLDKWDFCDDIKPAIEWGIKDDFWSLQIRSLAALRNKGSNGETKFTNIFDSWERSKAEKSKPKKKFEDPRNPPRKVLRRMPNGEMRGVWEN